MKPAIGTLLCPACGGAFPRNATACPYCGAVVVLPPPRGSDFPSERRTFCPRCCTVYPSSSGRCPACPPGATDERGGHCPRCTHDLEPQRLGEATVDVCPACHGTWFDGDELEHAMDVTTTGVSREEAVLLRRGLPRTADPLEEVHYLACVRCGERMSRRQIAMRTGIIVDICREHGVWFDGGELSEFQTFVRAGGLEVLRYDGVAQAEARRRSAERTEPVGFGPLGRLEPGGTIGQRADLGFDWVRALYRLFRRW